MGRAISRLHKTLNVCATVSDCFARSLTCALSSHPALALALALALAFHDPTNPIPNHPRVFASLAHL